MAEKPSVVHPEETIDLTGQHPREHEGAERDLPAVDQEREGQQTWAALTSTQFRGMWMGFLLGAVVGAVVLLPFGFIEMGDLALGWRLLILAGIGAMGGGTAGAVYWGGRMPEIKGDTPVDHFSR